MKNRFLYILVAVNTVAMAVFIQFPLLFIILLMFSAVISMRATYKIIHREDAAKKQDSLIVSSIFLFPLLILLISIIFALLIMKFSPTHEVSFQVPISYIPLMNAYYLLPSYVGVLYLLFAAALLVFAWRYRSSLFATIFLMLYTITLIIFIGYVVWWYMTGQEIQYI